MKTLQTLATIVATISLCSCISVSSGGYGNTAHELGTAGIRVDETLGYDVSPTGITYTIDISTAEGRLKLNGLNLQQAMQLALEEAAIKNNAAKLVSPKFTHLKKGKKILRITVFGFPARYKNVEKQRPGDMIIIK